MGSWLTRALLVATSLVLAPRLASADAIGPAPVADGCPRGSVSAVANQMHHGQLAYCAPALASAARPCWEGHAYSVVELMIQERVVWASSGHGAPVRAAPAARLAEVTGTCDAPDDEAPISARPDPLDGILMGGPSIESVPPGCRRLAVWLLDESVHCGAAPSEPAPAPEPPASPITTAPEVLPAEAAPVAPPAAEVPRIASRATPETATGSCACHASAPTGSSSGVVVLVSTIAAGLGRRRRRSSR